MTAKVFLKNLKKYKSYLISTHVHPDPDALSSLLTLAVYLRDLGKKVYLRTEEPVPERFRFLPGSRLIKQVNPGARADFEAVIVVDCGDLDRIGRVCELIKEKHHVINIDHHITNDKFGELNYVVPDASSTAEIIFDLLKEDRFRLTRDTALLLYLGIMTDTGSFRYDNTSAHTHAVVSELMKFRLPVGELYRRMYESVPLNDIKVFTRVVNNFETVKDGRAIILELTKNITKQFSEEFDLRDKIFKYLRTIKGVELLVILTELEKNRTRINFRSQSNVDVAKLAARFNGGGHHRASGAMLDLNIKDSKKKILREIRKII